MELSGDRKSADFFLILFYISYKLKIFAHVSSIIMPKKPTHVLELGFIPRVLGNP